MFPKFVSATVLLSNLEKFPWLCFPRLKRWQESPLDKRQAHIACGHKMPSFLWNSVTLSTPFSTTSWFSEAHNSKPSVRSKCKWFSDGDFCCNTRSYAAKTNTKLGVVLLRNRMLEYTHAVRNTSFVIFLQVYHLYLLFGGVSYHPKVNFPDKWNWLFNSLS